MSYYSGSYSSGLGASFLVSGLISLAIGILMIIAQWRLFTKAGEAGWKCLIPFYGQYIWCKIVWSAKIFWILLGIGLGTGVLSGILTAITANSYSRSPGAGVIIVGILMLAVAVIMLIIGIKMLIYTARAYGKSGGFAAGLFFLAPIFYCILAFGDSAYVGPMGIAGSKPGSDTADIRSANGDQFGTVTPDQADSSGHGLIWIIIGVCALILGFSAVQRFMGAMTNYKMREGIFGSPWVGLKNFELIFNSSMIPRLLINSAVSGAITVIVSLLFSLLGGAAGMSGSRAGKAIAAAVGAVIAFIPSIVFDYILISARLTATGGFNPLIPIFHALPIGGVSMMLGALLPSIWPRHRFAGVLIAPLLALASFFMDKSIVNPLQNALNQQYTETFSSYAYRIGFMSMNISASAATELTQSLLNLIPAVLGAVLIAVLVKKSRPAGMATPENRGGAGSSVAAGAIAGGIVILAGAALFSRNPSIIENSSVFRACIISLITALLVAFLAFAVYSAVLLCAGKFDPGRWFPITLLILLSVAFNRISIIDYLTARNLGLVNTIIMPALYAVANPLSIILLLAMIIIRPRRASSCILFALGAALLSAAYVVGDLSSFTVFVSNREGWNLGMQLRYALLNSLQTLSGAEIDPSAAETLRLSLMGTALLCVSVPLGIGTALCIHASLREG